MTTVLLVDDHTLMREGLRTLLGRNDDLHIVGDAENGRIALDMVKELSPQIVLMDVGMPELNGVEATIQIMAAAPETRVIGLSVHADRHYVIQMLRAGAAAYVLKNAGIAILDEAIRAVLDGQQYLCPNIAKTVIDEAVSGSSPTKPSAWSVLSAREREVLQLLAEGNTSKQIGASLFLSVKTIETHRRELMRKLDLHTVAELTKYALREGLTTLH